MNSKTNVMIQKLQAYTFAPILRWPSEEAKIWLHNLMPKLERNRDVCSVIATGSSIRKGVRSADLDLVVLFSGQAKKLDLPPVDVDLRAYSLDAVETLIWQGNDLLGWTVKYGKSLLDKGGAWRHLAQSLRPVPLPSADIAFERATKTEEILRTILDIGDSDAAQEQLLSLLTHLSRAHLIQRGIYPASRPELPQQLRGADAFKLAELLEQALRYERSPANIYGDLEEVYLNSPQLSLDNP